MPIELPRHVKKPGGLWKRVETQADLDAALAEGWVLRLAATAHVPEETSATVTPVGAPLEVPPVESDPSAQPVMLEQTRLGRKPKVRDGVHGS